MSKIQSYDVCVNADQLSNAEILLITALLIRGNYCNANKIYISFAGSNMKEKAIITVSNACAELGIPFKILDSDPRQDRYYLWGNTLLTLLAKQCLLPRAHEKWKYKIRIPDSWCQLSNGRIQLINNLVFSIAKFYESRYAKTIIRLPDNYVLASRLQRLLNSINKRIQCRRGDSPGSCPVLWHVKYIDHPQIDIPKDDISDLL